MTDEVRLVPLTFAELDDLKLQTPYSEVEAIWHNAITEEEAWAVIAHLGEWGVDALSERSAEAKLRAAFGGSND
jgi:hypothetical protein